MESIFLGLYNTPYAFRYGRRDENNTLEETHTPFPTFTRFGVKFNLTFSR